MDAVNFPTVALGLSLVCLIGVTLYAIAQRGAIRSRDEQLVVARAQAYAMLELSQAGVLFLDREHRIMGEASAAAPELLGHVCATGTPFDQVIADLVAPTVRRETIDYLESLWKADPAATLDATKNPLQRVHSGSRHLGIRFARLVVDGRVHHLIVAIERVSAPRVVPHTIEVPALNEETFARRLAGETGTRPALVLPEVTVDGSPSPVPAPPIAATLDSSIPAAGAETSASGTNAASAPESAPATTESAAPDVAGTAIVPPPLSTGEFELGPFDETSDSLASTKDGAPASPAHLAVGREIGDSGSHRGTATSENQLATTVTSLTAAASSALDSHPAATTAEPASPPPVIDPPDPRLNEVLEELRPVDAARLDHFLSEARDKAGQLRAIMKLPAREPQAFREKLVLILELIRGIHARAERLPLASVCERATRFEESLNALRDKQNLSGNDFLPLAVKLDDLLSHLAIQGEVATRLREWREKHGEPAPSIDATQRSATATGTTIRQPRIPPSALGGTGATTISQQLGDTSLSQKSSRLSDLSKESLEEMATFLADMYSRRVSLVVLGLEDVPLSYRRTVEKILGQLIHNAIRHGVEPPADRLSLGKPEIGTISVQFARAGDDGYQLSVQDDGHGLDHDRIRAEAVRLGVYTADEAATIDPRKLSSLIFRPGFTTAGDARGVGMDVVRELVHKANGRVGIATKPGAYTRFRITLPLEKKASSAQVA